MNRVINLMERAGALFLFTIMILITGSAIMRYLLNSPLPDGDSLSRLLLAIVVFWGLAGASLYDEHIQFDLLIERARGRIRTTMMATALIITLVAMTIFAWMAATRVLDLSRTGEKTFDLGLPLWPFYAVAWLGLVATVAALLWRLRGGRSYGPTRRGVKAHGL